MRAQHSPFQFGVEYDITRRKKRDIISNVQIMTRVKSVYRGTILARVPEHLNISGATHYSAQWQKKKKSTPIIGRGTRTVVDLIGVKL